MGKKIFESGLFFLVGRIRASKHIFNFGLIRKIHGIYNT